MKKFCITLFLALIAIHPYAQETNEDISDKLSLCASCHGRDGNSLVAEFPKIAQQNKRYLIKQMLDFQKGADGPRYNETMSALVTGYALEDIQHIAAYFAEQKVTIGAADEATLERGQQIYRGGDIQKEIPACIGCHSPRGLGNLQAGFPLLSGQYPEYTVHELLDFKSGERTNDYNHIMQDIAKRMDQSDMEAVANYIYGLH